MIFNALLAANGRSGPAGDPTASVPDTLSQSARDAADQWIARAAPILRDESDAADRIEPAFKRC